MRRPHGGPRGLERSEARSRSAAHDERESDVPSSARKRARRARAAARRARHGFLVSETGTTNVRECAAQRVRRAERRHARVGAKRQAVSRKGGRAMARGARDEIEGEEEGRAHGERGARAHCTPPRGGVFNGRTIHYACATPCINSGVLFAARRALVRGVSHCGRLPLELFDERAPTRERAGAPQLRWVSCCRAADGYLVRSNPRTTNPVPQHCCRCIAVPCRRLSRSRQVETARARRPATSAPTTSRAT